jgi:hypothetical protein
MTTKDMPQAKVKKTFDRPRKNETIRAKTMKQSSTGQEKWDNILNTPESDALLNTLIAQAQQEEQSGNFDEEDW